LLFFLSLFPVPCPLLNSDSVIVDMIKSLSQGTQTPIEGTENKRVPLRSGVFRVFQRCWYVNRGSQRKKFLNLGLWRVRGIAYCSLAKQIQIWIQVGPVLKPLLCFTAIALYKCIFTVQRAFVVLCPHMHIMWKPLLFSQSPWQKTGFIKTVHSDILSVAFKNADAENSEGWMGPTRKNVMISQWCLPWAQPFTNLALQSAPSWTGHTGWEWHSYFLFMWDCLWLQGT
jgi:hypothetical protein